MTKFISTIRSKAITSAAITFLIASLPTESLDANEEVVVMLPGDVPMTLVHVPAGIFMMGSPEDERGSDVLDNETLHQVTLTQDYYIGKTEVTQAQWAAVMGIPMPSSCGDFGIGDDYPVYCVSWNQMAGAGGFTETLNGVLGTEGFRLPTEAEWERAARGDTQTRFSHGDVLQCADDCSACAEHDMYMTWCGNDTGGPRLAGARQGNPFGIHDMHGNLWEFVNDRYGAYSASAQVDPTGPAVGNDRVLRGGDWNGDALFSRSASRVSANPGAQGANESVGFRIATSTLEGLVFQMDAGMNGNWWYGPGRSGEGVQAEISEGPGGTLTFVATFYSYDTLGNQIFMIAVGTVDGDKAEVDVYITEGGSWGDDFDPELVNETQWGTGVFTGISCDELHMELTPNAEYQAMGYTDLEYTLIRLTDPVIPCPLGE